MKNKDRKFQIPEQINRVVLSIAANGTPRYILWNDSIGKIVMWLTPFGQEAFDETVAEIARPEKWQQIGDYTWTRIPVIVVDRHLEELRDASTNGALSALLQFQQVIQGYLDYHKKQTLGFNPEEGAYIQGKEAATETLLEMLVEQINELKGTK